MNKCEFDKNGKKCQFAVPEEELTEFDDKRWCKFHLPMEDEDGKKSSKLEWTEEQNTEFIQAIHRYVDGKNGKEDINLNGVEFPYQIQFDGKIFKSPFIADDTIFNRWASFKKCNFLEGVSFVRVRFKRTQFNGAVFGAEEKLSKAVFNDACFNKDAYFPKCVFNHSASFMGCEFQDEAIFHGTRFMKGAGFGGKGKFKGEADFENVTFSQGMQFVNATFEDNALFKVYRPSSDSPDASIMRANFTGVTFNKKVSFQNRKFLGTTTFKDVVFHQAPDFHGCDLHQDTKFPKSKNFLHRSGGDDASAYRTLRLAMEHFRAHREQNMFFALEQISYRSSDKATRFERFASTIYQLFSDFGQSLSRPVFWFIGSLVVFSDLYYWIASTGKDKDLFLFHYNSWSCSGFWTAFHFSIEQVVRPFSVWLPKPGIIPPKGFDFDRWPIEALATFHSLLAITLVALFLLTLRWKFKRG